MGMVVCTIDTESHRQTLIRLQPVNGTKRTMQFRFDSKMQRPNDLIKSRFSAPSPPPSRRGAHEDGWNVFRNVVMYRMGKQRDLMVRARWAKRWRNEFGHKVNWIAIELFKIG